MDKRTGSTATSIVFQPQEIALATWPSNSRTTLSVHYYQRLQACRLVNGQHKRLSLSARTATNKCNVFRPQEFTVATWPSNSRTTLSVQYNQRPQARRLDTGQDKRLLLSVKTFTDKHTVRQLLELTVATWPSNSRTILSVQYNQRLQARRLDTGQHKRLSFSAKTVKSHQVAVQARQATSASGQVMDFNHRRLQRRLAPNQKARTRQAGERTWNISLRHTARK